MIKLVTGGQRSGKSAFAEGLLRDKKNVAYIATATVDGEEMKDRVRKHQESRPASWRTIERYDNFLEDLGDEDYYLFECVGTMTSNIMFNYTRGLERVTTELATTIENHVFDSIKELIDYVNDNNKDLVIITNEVGFSLTSQNHIGRVYTDILGRLSQRLASISDEVYLVVAGIEVRIK